MLRVHATTLSPISSTRHEKRMEGFFDCAVDRHRTCHGNGHKYDLKRIPHHLLQVAASDTEKKCNIKNRNALILVRDRCERGPQNQILYFLKSTVRPAPREPAKRRKNASNAR
ncbi:unnamed protein product [Amoebophrya sp. A120]|nr:unnamed protein product [Amoebophrya sp. A120]|eukprot:GSA120T00003480001.1